MSVSATSSSTTTSVAAQDAATISGDFNFFLKMLTTQLKNQDPTEPMDVSQMTAQIAQYSMVEQQVKSNANLEALLASNKQSQLSTAVSYIGREVETEGNTGNLIGSQATFSYQLPDGAHAVLVTIKDASGRAVFQGAGTTREGGNLVVWDGVNSFTDAQEADGEYSISVEAQDAEGKAVAADTRAVGTVAAVENDGEGNITLTVGTVKVPYDQILAVRNPTRVEVADEGGDGGDEESDS